MPDALGEFEGFESMHAGRPPVGVALIGRSGMRQMRGEEMSSLVRKPLGQILAFWRPGSHDDGWTWEDEYGALVGLPETERVRNRLRQLGPSADCAAPVLLGPDGRVWDGHHRIVIAIQDGTPSLMVEIVGLDRADQIEKGQEG